MWIISQCTHLSFQNGSKGPNTHTTAMYSNSTLLRSLTSPLKQRWKMLLLQNIKCSNRFCSHPNNQRMWKKKIFLCDAAKAYGQGKGHEVLQWTPVPFKMYGKILIDIQSDILLLLKLTKGSSLQVLLSIEI